MTALELAASGEPYGCHPLSEVRRAVIAAEVRRSREAQGLPVKVADPDTLRRIASMIRRAASARGDVPASGRGARRRRDPRSDAPGYVDGFGVKPEPRVRIERLTLRRIDGDVVDQASNQSEGFVTLVRRL